MSGPTLKTIGFFKKTQPIPVGFFLSECIPVKSSNSQEYIWLNKLYQTAVVWQLESLFLPLNERFRFLPLEGSMSRCLYLQISGFFFLMQHKSFGFLSSNAA